MSPTQVNPHPSPSTDRSTLVLARIRDALDGLRYGEVIVKVQDGVVVQVDRTERVRLEK
jgi:hypothetical protein